MIGLHFFIIVSALAHFASIIFDWQIVFYITKPLTMVLLITLCALAFRKNHDSLFTKLFIMALIFSLAGDVFLMLPSPSYFLPGLFAFFLAHVFYVAGLWRDNKWRKGDYITGGILLILAVGVFWYLFPFLEPELIIPVALYIIVISVMVWRAVGASFREFLNQHQQRLVIIGAILFFVSDLILAINRFAHPLPMSTLLIMIPYFAGQYCLACSVYSEKNELI